MEIKVTFTPRPILRGSESVLYNWNLELGIQRPKSRVLFITEGLPSSLNNCSLGSLGQSKTPSMYSPSRRSLLSPYGKPLPHTTHFLKWQTPNATCLVLTSRSSFITLKTKPTRYTDQAESLATNAHTLVRASHSKWQELIMTAFTPHIYESRLLHF